MAKQMMMKIEFIFAHRILKRAKKKTRQEISPLHPPYI